MLIIKKTEHRAGIRVNYTHSLVVSLRSEVSVQKGQETWCTNNLAMKDTELTDSLGAIINDIKQTLHSVRDTVLTWLCIKQAVKDILRRNEVHRANLARQNKVRIKEKLKRLAVQAQRESENDNILMQQTHLMKQDNSRVKNLMEFSKRMRI
jgi:hypothetical protein